MASRSYSYPHQAVWTRASTVEAVFHPVGNTVASNSVHGVRASFDLRQSSGNIKVRAAFRTTDDPNGAWDAPVAFGPDYTATEGRVDGEAFYHLPAMADRKRFTQFGLLAVNSGGAEVEYAAVALRLDLESRVLDIPLRTIDVTNYKASVNPNTMTFSVTDQGGGVHRVSLTGDGNIRDGSSEGVTLRFDPVDSAGNIVDISGQKWGVIWEVTLSSVTAGDSLIVMPGVSAQADDASDGEIRLAGFTTYTSGAPRRSVTGDRFNNYTTASTDLEKVIGVYVPMPVSSGTTKMGGFIVYTLNTAGAYINNTYALSGNEITPDPFEFVLFLGFDTAHTNTKTADITLKMVAFPMYE